LGPDGRGRMRAGEGGKAGPLEAPRRKVEARCLEGALAGGGRPLGLACGAREFLDPLGLVEALLGGMFRNPRWEFGGLPFASPRKSPVVTDFNLPLVHGYWNLALAPKGGP